MAHKEENGEQGDSSAHGWREETAWLRLQEAEDTSVRGSGGSGASGRMSALLHLLRAPRRAVLRQSGLRRKPENPPFLGHSEHWEPVGAHFGPENRVKWEHELQVLWLQIKGSEREAVCIQGQVSGAGFVND